MAAPPPTDEARGPITADTPGDDVPHSATWTTRSASASRAAGGKSDELESTGIGRLEAAASAAAGAAGGTSGAGTPGFTPGSDAWGHWAPAGQSTPMTNGTAHLDGSPSRRTRSLLSPPSLFPPLIDERGILSVTGPLVLPTKKRHFNLTSVIDDPREPDRNEPIEIIIPPLDPRRLPPVEWADFVPYIKRMQRAQAQSLGGPDTPAHRTLPGDAVSCYDLVPPDFFKATFSLDDPIVFESLLCGSHYVAQQTKLSQCLDAVEIELLRAIDTRAQDFFHALSTLQELRHLVMGACQEIAHLKERMADLRQRIAVRSLAIIALRRRRANMAAMRKMTRYIVAVRRSESTVADLFKQRDYAGALELIDSTQDLLMTELVGVACVSRVKGRLEKYRDDIGQTLVKEFVSSSISLITAGSVGIDDDLDGHTDSDSVTVDTTNDVDDADAPPDTLQYRVRLDATLRPLLAGLIKVKSLHEALGQVKDRLGSEVRQTVSTVVYTTLASMEEMGELPAGTRTTSTNDAGQVSSKTLRSLPMPQFTKLVRQLLASLSALMDRGRLLHEFCVSVLDVATPAVTRRRARAAELVPAAWYDRIGLLHALRQKFLAGFPVADDGTTDQATADRDTMADVYMLCRREHRLDELGRFLISHSAATEADVKFGADLVRQHGGKRNAPMPVPTVVEPPDYSHQQIANMIAQSKAILMGTVETVHKHIARLLSARREEHSVLNHLEFHDLWVLCKDFVAVTSNAGRHMGIMEELVKQATSILERMHARHETTVTKLLEMESWKSVPVPPEFQRCASIVTGASPDLESRSAAPTPNSAGESVMPAHISLGGRTFAVVSSTMMLIKLFSECMTCAYYMPEVSGTVAKHIAELGRMYNQTTTQLVLGAGAKRNAAAEVTVITPKHLSAAAGSLSCIATALPAIKARLSTSLPPEKHVYLDDLMELRTAIIAHLSRITEKLVVLLVSSCKRQLAPVPAMDWNEPAPPPSEPMAMVLKDIEAVRKALTKPVRSEQFVEVFALSAVQLVTVVQEIYSRVPLASATSVARERMMADIRRLSLCLQRPRELTLPVDRKSGAPMNKPQKAIALLEDWAEDHFGVALLTPTPVPSEPGDAADVADIAIPDDVAPVPVLNTPALDAVDNTDHVDTPNTQE